MPFLTLGKERIVYNRAKPITSFDKIQIRVLTKLIPTTIVDYPQTKNMSFLHPWQRPLTLDRLHGARPVRAIQNSGTKKMCQSSFRPPSPPCNMPHGLSEQLPHPDTGGGAPTYIPQIEFRQGRQAWQLRKMGFSSVFRQSRSHPLGMFEPNQRVQLCLYQVCFRVACRAISSRTRKKRAN
jgi:hypothetical protein